jgi:hypothetical protein
MLWDSKASKIARTGSSGTADAGPWAVEDATISVSVSAIRKVRCFINGRTRNSRAG